MSKIEKSKYFCEKMFFVTEVKNYALVVKIFLKKMLAYFFDINLRHFSVAPFFQQKWHLWHGIIRQAIIVDM